MPVIKHRFLRRTLKILIPFVLIPAIAVIGTVTSGKWALLLSLLAAGMSLLLLVAGFERKDIGTRRTVLTAVMIALSVIGRLIPLFKPITALTILTALYLGGEAGFAVGACTALVSGMVFGLGPWTPFQMLAWGLVGLMAGGLSRPLRRSRPFLLVFGALSGIFFSLVMDVWTVLWYEGAGGMAVYFTAVLTAIPHTLLYAVSNLIFLALLAKPFGEKMERMQKKYGI